MSVEAKLIKRGCLIGSHWFDVGDVVVIEHGDKLDNLMSAGMLEVIDPNFYDPNEGGPHSYLEFEAVFEQVGNQMRVAEWRPV